MLRDLLWACRWLGKNRLFALATAAILALGTGANTAIFSIVDAVLLRPLPYEAADRLVRIEETSTKGNRSRIPSADYQLLASRTDLFEKVAAHLRDDVTIYGAGEPSQVTARRVTPDLFSLLGAHARLGRTLGGDSHEAVLSERLWQRQFHGDSGAIGRAILIGDESYTIVGVMPAGFEFPYADVEMWIPFQATPGVDFGYQGMAARLRQGLTATQAQNALDIAARQLEQQDPRKNAGLRITVSPYRDDLGAKYEQTLVLVLAAVGLVLLIACADVASLLLSRAVQRQKEIAVRASLGAVFGRLLRQLLAEGLVVAIAGSAAGLAVAYYTLRLLVKQIAAMPIPLAHMHRVGINGRVLAFNIALCLMLAALVSIAPAVMAFRTNLQDVLRSGQRAGGSRGAARLFSILIACEAAFAFLLLVGSGLMVRSLIRLQQSDHGIHADHVLTMRVPIGSLTQTRPKGQYATKPRQMEYYRAILERLERVPGVDAAAVVNNLPLSGVNTTLLLEPPGKDPIGVPARTISAQYFRVMGIPLVAGRFFTHADTAGAPPVCIVNEYLAAQMFPGRDAIGQKLADGATVVGVVRNTPQASYEAPAKEEMYRPYQQVIFGVFLSTMVVRTSRDPLSLAPALRKEVWAVDPNQPIVKVETMNQIITDSIWRPRFSAWLFSVLGGLALLLTSAGVYSVMAYTTALRAREVGIRVALGATPRNVVATIVRGAMVPLVTGLVVSGVASLFLARLLASVLYEVKVSDPATYAGAAAILVGIGVAASAIPAWRAAAGDPVEALRTE
ncbi:MAG TPA: ABC transporter permease [Bryobacteraceae bacterium]